MLLPQTWYKCHLPLPPNHQQAQGRQTLMCHPPGPPLIPCPPIQALTKRPRAPSELQTVLDDDGATTDTPDDAPKTKKSKKTPSQHVGLQNESSIISIDDTDDIQNERLNKIDATVDIKEFFIPLPPLPGQDKGCMQCMLCRYVLFLSGFIFLS